MLDVPHATTTEGGGETRFDLRKEAEAAGITDTLQQLEQELVGLRPVKNRVRQIASLLLIERIRQRAGLASAPPTLHMSFTGNPGTGKTTVALRMAKILHGLGFVRRGQVISVTRDDLVGQYIGHTAPKTKEILKKAMGGVLFIDEAYYLHRPDNERDYGQEAIEILLQVMENQREDLVVILAGYGERMTSFFASNPGFRSRIAHHIDLSGLWGGRASRHRGADAQGARLSLLGRRARGLREIHRIASDPAVLLQCALDPQRGRPHPLATGRSAGLRSRPHA
ncbi:SpoVK/Ycf46/Vps4 family AAA+-type ATPase [Bradyrhizobium sp. LM2.7]